MVSFEIPVSNDTTNFEIQSVSEIELSQDDNVLTSIQAEGVISALSFAVNKLVNIDDTIKIMNDVQNKLVKSVKIEGDYDE